MSFRRFDPHQSTVSQDPSLPSNEPSSPDREFLERASHSYRGLPPLNSLSSQHFESHGAHIPLPPSDEEFSAHRLQDGSTSSQSPSSHIQLGLEGIRPSNVSGLETPDLISRYPINYAGETEYSQRSHAPHGAGTWEPPKREKATSAEIAPVPRRLLATFMAASGLLIAGFIGYSLFKKNGQRSASEAPPIIEADKTPVKVAPQVSASTDEPNKHDMRIYEKIDTHLSRNEGSVDHSTDLLIRKEEAPLIESKNQLPFQEFGQGQDASAHMDSQGGLPPPKQVKTVIMRPDGTILAQSTKIADPSQHVSSAENTSIASPLDENEESKISSQRPEGAKEKNSSLLQAQKRNTRAPKEASGKSEDGALNGGRGFSVQLAATSSEKEALLFFETLQRRYGVLNEKTPHIYKVNLAGKMVYRLRVRTASQDESTSLCQTIQAQGGSCFVARN